MIDTDKFLTALNTEKMAAQERRGDLIAKKLSWVTGLFAVGSVNLTMIKDSTFLLCFVPVISLIFDLYIYGENYGIKRMGCFVRLKMPDAIDGQWESWLRPRRDKFSLNALLLSSFIILFACATALTFEKDWVHGVLLLLFAIPTLAIHMRAIRSLNKLDNKTLPEFLEEIAQGNALINKGQA